MIRQMWRQLPTHVSVVASHRSRPAAQFYQKPKRNELRIKALNWIQSPLDVVRIAARVTAMDSTCFASNVSVLIVFFWRDWPTIKQIDFFIFIFSFASHCDRTIYGRSLTVGACAKSSVIIYAHVRAQSQNPSGFSHDNIDARTV